MKLFLAWYRTALLGIALLSFVAISSASAVTLLSEGFDNVPNLGASGWVVANNSNPLGTKDWFQGDSGNFFPAHSGSSNSYIAADFNSTDDVGTISNWLITPSLTLHNGDQVSFFTRTLTGSSFPDRLELRLSTNGTSTNVGTTESSVGDFTTVLLTINSSLAIGGYPEEWAMYTVAISGLSGDTLGRLAFHYDVTSGGFSGGFSNYIGIDSLNIESVPEPNTIALLIIFLAYFWGNFLFRRNYGPVLGRS